MRRLWLFLFGGGGVENPGPLCATASSARLYTATASSTRLYTATASSEVC